MFNLNEIASFEDFEAALDAMEEDGLTYDEAADVIHI